MLHAMPMKTSQNYLHEPARETPVVQECDLCVLGGSCTGVFAAVRAARLGLSVAIIERMGSFGGVATLSQVNVWHTFFDEVFQRQIIGGLSRELIESLQKRGAVSESPNNLSVGWYYNSAEMQIELDELVLKHSITPWLHSNFVAPHLDGDKLNAVIIENKSGRGAIKARFFIDATGDGDLCRRLPLTMYSSANRQPSTTCALFGGWESLRNIDWQKLTRDHGAEFNLPQGFAWSAPVPGTDSRMLAGTRVYQDCSDATGLTQAEMEGRRQVRAIQDLLRRYAPEAKIGLQALPARIGIRETCHVRCLHQLTGEELLGGKRYPDAIANGSYRVDIHHHDKPGITLRYLDGRQEYVCPGQPWQPGRWRPESAENPTFYQIPYRCLVPQGPFENLLAAGRFIDANDEAHGAIRVMVNMNQTGEAAGVAAWLALEHQQSAAQVDVAKLRKTLADGGSVML